MSFKKTARLLAVPMAAALTLGSVSAAGLAAGPGKAYAFVPADAETAIEAFNEAFWDEDANYFWKTTNRDTYMDFWVEAELWELVMDAYIHASDPDLKAELRTQIDDVFAGAVAKYGEDWTNNPFNDDIMWWAMGSARAYELTGDPLYLEKAKYYFDYVYDTQWDDEFAGGGIWWKSDDRTTKNACINFPAAETAVFLYERTGDEHYLDAASRIYRWGKTMLTDGSGKVFDRIETVKGAVPDATHYNQGTFIGAAVGLYRVTGNAVYLDDAVKAADFTKSKLVDANGLLRFEGPNGDLKGGKTILVRNLAYLQKTLNGLGEGPYEAFSESFDEWLTFNAETAWSHRNASGLVDGNWAGQLLSGTYEAWSSSGAVEALTVLKPGDAEVRYAEKEPYGRIEAESYNIANGVVLEGSIEGSLQLGGIQHGSYAAYKNVDFGTDGMGAVGFIARAASGTGGGLIEIRLDAVDGPKVGTLNVEGTGGWNNYTDAVALLKDDAGKPAEVTGRHDVYLVFAKTNDQYLFNLNWFSFTKTDPTKTDAYARLKAAGFDAGEGVNVNADGGFLDGIRNGAYAAYKGIDFGTGASGVTVRVSSGNQGGTIEVRLHSLDGPVAGTVDIPALGDWNGWVDLTALVDKRLAAGVHDAYLTFRGANGSDYPCNLDWFSFSQVEGKARDAYGKLEAENYTAGVNFGTETGGGQTYLAGIYGPNNPYAMYNYIDFGSESPAKFHLQAASDTAGGTLEVRLDGINGPLIASADVAGTGGWQKFQVFSADVTIPVTGKHVVFLLFKGDDWLYNLDKFTFGDPAVLAQPDEPPVPPRDDVPPGEVENVQAVREADRLKLQWDGPYDIDAQKVRIALHGEDGGQIGETLEVSRGVQTAVVPGIEAGKSYAIGIKAVDASGNVSAGIAVEVKAQPLFTLSAGGKELKEGDSFEDYLPLRFQADPAAKLARVVVDGRTYELDPASAEGLDIDLAGSLGEKTAFVTIEDASGSTLEKSFAFRVTTNVTSMKHLLGRYGEAGELGGPLAGQLAGSLEQAGRQLDAGMPKQAAQHMQSFAKHLNNEAMARYVGDAAKAALNADAEALIAAWQEE